MTENKTSAAQQPPLDHKIELAAETAHFAAKSTVTGRVRIKTITEQVNENVDGSLLRSKIEVERVPLGVVVDVIPETRVVGNVTIIPVFEERLVVERRLFLMEELHVRHIETTETVSIPVTVRRQRATVERLAAGSPSAAQPETPPWREDMSIDTYSTRGEIVTAFFDDRSEADSAVERIVSEGISRGEIRVVAGTDTSATDASGRPAEEKGLFEAIGDFFMPDEDRHAYAEGLRRGGYLVTVPTTAENRDRVLDILDDEGTVNMDEREESWRSEGWSGRETGYDAELTSARAGVVPVGGAYAAGSTAPDASTRDGDRDGTLDVVAETMRVGKRDVSHGRVKVRSYVVEDDVSEDVSLRNENVEISRRAVDRPVESFDGAFKDRTIEMEETSQEAIVSKEARVIEEIDLNRTVRDRTETVSDTVRRTEVEIEDDRVAGGRTLTSEERARRGV